jgi:hypothetical protein
MTQGKSSVGFWLLIGTLVLGGGVGIYFLLRKPKEEKAADGGDENLNDKKIITTPTNLSSGGVIGSGSGSGSSSGSTKPKSNAPSELNSENKIKAFQNYVLQIKKDKTILGKTGADGDWGGNSQNAWDKYGADFKKSETYKGFDITTTDEDIRRIIDFATGKKSNEGYLKSSPKTFVKKWSDTIKNKKTAFIWANQVYRTKTGEQVMSFNPTIFNLKTSKGGNLRASPNPQSSPTQISAGVNLGKGSAVAFSDPYLYIYLPSKSKWIASSLVSKASSSFTGGEEEIWAEFDDNFDISFK